MCVCVDVCVRLSHDPLENQSDSDRMVHLAPTDRLTNLLSSANYSIGNIQYSIGNNTSNTNSNNTLLYLYSALRAPKVLYGGRGTALIIQHEYVTPS